MSLFVTWGDKMKTKPIYILTDIGEQDAFFSQKDRYIGNEFTMFSNVHRLFSNKEYYCGGIVFKDDKLNVHTYEIPHITFYKFKYIKLPISRKSFLKRYGMLVFTNPKLFEKLLAIVKVKEDELILG